MHCFLDSYNGPICLLLATLANSNSQHGLIFWITVTTLVAAWYLCIQIYIYLCIRPARWKTEVMSQSPKRQQNWIAVLQFFHETLSLKICLLSFPFHNAASRKNCYNLNGDSGRKRCQSMSQRRFIRQIDDKIQRRTCKRVLREPGVRFEEWRIGRNVSRVLVFRSRFELKWRKFVGVKPGSNILSTNAS